MRSCTVVVINEALSKDDVRFSAKPKTNLRAVPLNTTSKQIVKESGDTSVDVFSVFEVPSSMPANLTGMALFLVITDPDKTDFQVKGKVNTDFKNLVHFKTVEDIGLDSGFYKYEVLIKAKDFEQSLLSGSYVVR